MVFLINNKQEVWQAIKKYFVGTFQHSFGAYTCFPYIDRKRRIERGKLMRFNQETGKRLKGEYDASSLSAKLKQEGKLKEDFQLGKCLFGEHLLSVEKEKLVCIVEAEKTAVIAAIYFPESVWLACGSMQNLTHERLERIGRGRSILLYPDADEKAIAFNLWTEKAHLSRLRGLTIKVSNLIEKHATDQQKIKGYDLADYLIEQQTRINQYNSFVENYNNKLATVLRDEKLFRDFQTIFEEQLAVLMINGKLSEIEAERQTTNFGNLRRIILSL